DPPPLADQLARLGRQALDQGRPRDAAAFFRKALALDPAHAEAKKGLDDRLVQVAMQDPMEDPAPPPPAPARPPPAPPGHRPPAPPARAAAASIERQPEPARVRAQRLTAEIRDRQARARERLNEGDANAALDVLRRAINAVQSDVDVPEAVRNSL